MRDSSPRDVADLWVARMIEQADWATSPTICFAVIRQAAQRIVDEGRRHHINLIDDLECAFENQIASLRGQPGQDYEGRVVREWRLPEGIDLVETTHASQDNHHTSYWTTDMWKRDFLRTLETQFWAYRNYAHAADKGKMKFLRELAEVWIAAATTALVRYSGEDKSSWRWTSQLLRRHAKMVDDDGLRSLEWGLLEPKDAGCQS